MAAETDTPEAEAWNEAFDRSGAPREGYRRILDALEAEGAAAARDRAAGSSGRLGVEFAGRPFRVDPVPRVIPAPEWDRLARGIEQRLRAIMAFLADAYGPRRAVAAGVLPDRLIEESRYREPRGAAALGAPWATVIAGPDLIRDPDGELLVVEDNLRTPSGFAYAAAARAATRGLPGPAGGPADPEAGLDRLAAAIRGAAPDRSERPEVVLLSDGEEASARFEHRRLAERLGATLAAPDRLEARDGRLLLRHEGGTRPVDVLYNRSSQESLTGPDGGPTELGRLLSGPIEAGTLSCVNPFGAGLADDKALHPYLDRLIGFYLGEEPLLRSIRGLDPGQPEQLAETLERLPELVLKPRFSFGGQGVMIGPAADRDELERAARELRRDPGAFSAQEMIELSVHPTACDGGFEPRRVDLRLWAIAARGEVEALPLALTRFSGRPGEYVVNSTHGGGAKDTWLP